jgi:hypothetical protein
VKLSLSLSTLLASGLAFGLVMTACGAPLDESATSTDSSLAARPPVGRGLQAAMMRAAEGAGDDESTEPALLAAGVQLQYFGGPVLANVVVHAVYWGESVAFQSHLNDFYGTITSSSYLDWLSEYDTPTQHIGRGSFAGATAIRPAHTGAPLTDDQIQAELSAQIDAGILPQPDGMNDLFMIHFPPSVSIKGPGGAITACVEFCAYHWAFKKGDTTVYYGVMPDLVDTGCARGCGAGTPQENTTSVASHELVEAITDGAIGLAQKDGTPAWPMAWYRNGGAHGEIGDICNAMHGQSSGFTVQKQWSNRQNKCVVSGPAQ